MWSRKMSAIKYNTRIHKMCLGMQKLHDVDVFGAHRFDSSASDSSGLFNAKYRVKVVNIHYECTSINSSAAH